MEFHGPVQCIGRSSGRSAVASIAYRTGGRFYDERYQLVHDYSRKRGVECVISAAPEDAPDWLHDPEKLWNAAEAAEKKRNATVARELELALPAFLSLEDRREIVEDVARFLVEEYRVAVTAALHEPSRQGDQRNFHAHIMFTTREIDAAGFGRKTRVLDDLKQGPREITKIRQAAADIINDVLKKNNSDLRVDPRSFKERGIDKTPQQHLGPVATEMERDGRESHRGRENREIERSNAEITTLAAERDALDKAIEEERERLSHPPSTREDARERLDDYASFHSEARREKEARKDTSPARRLAAWRRHLHTAYQFVNAFVDRARNVWQYMAGWVRFEPHPEREQQTGPPGWADSLRERAQQQEQDWQNRTTNRQQQTEREPEL